METKDSTSRLDRIETKIDKLAETMISLARAEEKLIGLESDKTFMMERMLKNEERVDTIEKKVDESAVTVKVVNRVFWILVAVVASALVGQQFI
jgi:tetrahydromethanopterin S-methyltransferase subunit G